MTLSFFWLIEATQHRLKISIMIVKKWPFLCLISWNISYSLSVWRQIILQRNFYNENALCKMTPILFMPQRSNACLYNVIDDNNDDDKNNNNNDYNNDNNNDNNYDVEIIIFMIIMIHSSDRSIKLSGSHRTQTQTSEVMWAARSSGHWVVTSMFA